MTTPSYLNSLYSGSQQGMPEVGSTDYQAMLDSIPAQYTQRANSNKTRFSGMMQGAGLDPNNFDYGQINPEIYDALGSNDPRALSLSNFDQNRDQRVMDSQAYINSAKGALANNWSDDQMWADYDKNKYKQSGFQNFMQSGIKAGLGAMVGAGIGDAAGLWNLGGSTTGGLGTMPTMTGSVPQALPSLSSGFTPMAVEGGGMLSAAEAAGLTSSIGAQAAIPAQIGNAATTAAGTLQAGLGGGLSGSSILNGAKAGGTLLSQLTGGGGLRDIVKAGSSVYSALKGKEGADATQNALQTQMQTLNDMYKEGSPWAMQLKEQLARKDAAAGRNSQYGARLSQYQALLADKAGQNAGVLGQLATQAGAANKDSNGYLNLLLNRGGDVANSLGLTDKIEDKASQWGDEAWDYFFGG